MFVLIPHSADELQLFHLQKELIKILNTENLFFSAVSPLWIPLDLPSSASETAKKVPASEIQLLKNISKKINRVSLENLNYDFSNSSLRTIFCEVSIHYEQQIIKTQLPLLQEILKNKSSSDSDIKTALQNINKDLKIFRLGIQTTTEQTNSCAISESVWCKIK